MHVADTLTCPRCRITCSVEADQDPITIEYNYDEWRKQCVHANVDGLATCPEMLPRLRRMISRLSRH